MNCSHPSKHRKNERGNVLFYILIAVALIASLSYVVANSSRGGGGTIDAEKSKMAASEILEYSTIIGNAAAQLKLRGCRDTELSFENTITATDYANTGDPTGDQTCHIFHVNGGGVQYRAPDATILDTTKNSESFYGEYLFTAKTCIPNIGTGDLDCQTEGASTADLIIALPYIKKSVCVEINNSLGIGNTGDDPPEDVASAWNSSAPEFIGTFAGGTRLRDDATDLLVGKNTGCFLSDATPDTSYVFYRVLIAR